MNSQENGTQAHYIWSNSLLASLVLEMMTIKLVEDTERDCLNTLSCTREFRLRLPCLQYYKRCQLQTSTMLDKSILLELIKCQASIASSIPNLQTWPSPPPNPSAKSEWLHALAPTSRGLHLCLLSSRPSKILPHSIELRNYLNWERSSSKDNQNNIYYFLPHETCALYFSYRCHLAPTAGT